MLRIVPPNRLIGSLMLALSVAATTSCTTPLSDAECESLLVRYSEKLLESDRPDLSREERMRLREKSKLLAGQDPAFRACSDNVGRVNYECAMHAGSVDEIERCLL